MIKRIYFLTSEIIPFAESHSLASFSKEIPIVFNERKYDFRVMMPKYSFISERRYILREVIRLREMSMQYRSEQITASVKSAFIPNTKVQVYFLEHPFYYHTTDTDLYPLAPEKNEQRNAIRFGYFAYAALTTLNYLRWKPEVIIVNDWQMSLIPLLMNADLLNKDYFEGVKVLQIVHSKSPQANFTNRDYAEVGLKNYARRSQIAAERNVIATAFPYCQHVLFINKNDDLFGAYLNDPVYSSLIQRDKRKFSVYECKEESTEEWQNLANEIIRLVEQI